MDTLAVLPVRCTRLIDRKRTRTAVKEEDGRFEQAEKAEKGTQRARGPVGNQEQQFPQVGDGDKVEDIAQAAERVIISLEQLERHGYTWTDLNYSCCRSLRRLTTIRALLLVILRILLIFQPLLWTVIQSVVLPTAPLARRVLHPHPQDPLGASGGPSGREDVGDALRRSRAGLRSTHRLCRPLLPLVAA